MSVRLAAGTPWLDTSADEARLAEAGFAVQRLEPGDPDFARLMTGWSPHLAWEVEQSARRRPSACHVARRTGTGDYVAFACHHSNRAGWFGPMGTDPSVRRFGIGSVLLRRCLADLAAQGRTEAQIAWVGPIGFYARGVGARISRVFWLFEKVLVMAEPLRTGLMRLLGGECADLRGARAALLTHPGAVLPDLTGAAEALARSPEVHLVALLGPEHGVRGSAPAGATEHSSVDG